MNNLKVSSDLNYEIASQKIERGKVSSLWDEKREPTTIIINNKQKKKWIMKNEKKKTPIFDFSPLMRKLTWVIRFDWPMLLPIGWSCSSCLLICCCYYFWLGLMLNQWKQKTPHNFSLEKRTIIKIIKIKHRKLFLWLFFFEFFFINFFRFKTLTKKVLRILYNLLYFN